MAQSAAITLNRKDPSVTETFKPRAASPGLTTFVADLGGMAKANPTLVLALDAANARRNTDLCKAKLTVPLVRFIGDPSFAHTEVKHKAIGKIDVTMPSVATRLEREDMQAMLESLIVTAVWRGYTEDLEPSW
jgi:hypothetical protein